MVAWWWILIAVSGGACFGVVITAILSINRGEHEDESNIEPR